MKWFNILILVVLLAACGTEVSNNEQVENIPAEITEQAPFTLRLVSDKEQYQVGEPLSIKAELIYDGDEEAIQIGHAGSWIWLETTNLTKNYQFGAAMNEPYIMTKMIKGEALAEPYHFSGGTYFKGMDGNAYTEDMYKKMAAMEFPPGQYQINGRTDFIVEGKQGEKYHLEASIIFEVVE